MPARWNADNRPPSLAEFTARFPTDDACAAYLEARRWPDGFFCPECGSCRAWKLQTKRWTWECHDCGHQTSVTAGTVMHGTKAPLRTWFLAAHLLATHSNGMSALQLQAKLSLGSYKTAWLLLHKLRRAMIAPARTPLFGNVEVDETTIPYRTKDEPADGGQGRSQIGKMAAHVLMPWIHRVFANMKRWGLGVFHGFREKYLNAYLNEFVFRWNRRHSYRSAFERLVGVGLSLTPATCADIRAAT